MKDLLNQGFTKRREYEQAKAAINSASAELELAKQQYRLLDEMIGPGELRQSELKLAELERKVSEQKMVAQHKMALKNAGMIRLNHRYEVLKKSLKSAEAMLENCVGRASAWFCCIQDGLGTGRNAQGSGWRFRLAA